MLVALVVVFALVGCDWGGAAGAEPQPSASGRGVGLAQRPASADDLVIYLPRLFEDDSLGLREVRRPLDPGGDRVRQALEALIRGPSGDERADDYQYPLDPHTTVGSIRMDGGLAMVELDERISSVHGRPYSELVFWSIVYTLTQAPGVSAVRLQQRGEPLARFGDPPIVLPPTAGRDQAPAWARPR